VFSHPAALREAKPHAVLCAAAQPEQKPSAFFDVTVLRELKLLKFFGEAAPRQRKF
jgi:hypothetical protein